MISLREVWFDEDGDLVDAVLIGNSFDAVGVPDAAADDFADGGVRALLVAVGPIAVDDDVRPVVAVAGAGDFDGAAGEFDDVLGAFGLALVTEQGDLLGRFLVPIVLRYRLHGFPL